MEGLDVHMASEKKKGKGRSEERRKEKSEKLKSERKDEPGGVESAERCYPSNCECLLGGFQ